MKLKKLLSGLLCACMIFGMCACASKESNDGAANDNGEKIKIGYTFWDSTTAGLGRDAAGLMKLAAEALNIELMFNTSSDTTAEGVIAAVENFIAAGCQGVVVCNFSESSMVNIARLCEDRGVYFAQFFRTINDEEIAKQLEGNPYYVGRVYEDEYAAAYALGQAIADAGATNVAMINSMHGDTTYETRAQAYRDAIEDFGMNLTIEQWDVPTDASATEVVVNMLNAYPEIDGFLLGNCTYTPYVLTGQKNAGINDPLPMVGVDFDITLGDMIKEGSITAVAGGHHSDPLFALLMVYNAINGAYDSAEFPLDVVNNMLTVENLEDYENYCKWMIDIENNFYAGQAFTMEEIQDMAITFNPDTTIEDIREAAASMSIENVMERHKDLVKE